MSVQIPPKGTRGGAFPRMPGPLMRLMNDTMFRIFRNRPFQGAGPLMALTTFGARSGQQRRSTVMYFPETDNSWLIVASAGGAAMHPAWFFNLAKNPHKVWVEVRSRKVKVAPEMLSGAERASAWQRIVAKAPAFAGYEAKTDREIPVIRLSATP